MENKKVSGALQVRYHNSLNRVSLGDLLESELNLFFAICAKAKSTDGTVTISFADLKRIAQYSQTSNDALINCLMSMNGKLTKLSPFQEFTPDKETKTLTAVLTPNFLSLLKAKANFTKFKLEEFASVNGVYAKRLYCMLRQYETTGFYKVAFQDFKRIFNIPDCYKMCNIDNKIIHPAIEELSKLFDNLVVKKLKNSSGKVVALQFTFSNKAIDVTEKPRTKHPKAEKQKAEDPKPQTEKSWIDETNSILRGSETPRKRRTEDEIRADLVAILNGEA